MNYRTAAVLATAFLAAAGSGAPARAQTTYGGASMLVLPIVARTLSYQSTLFVFSPTSSVTFSVSFVGPNWSPGSVNTCDPLTVAAGTTVSTTLSALCPLLPPGSQFGMVILKDVSAVPLPQRVTAYTRVDTPGGNGFSVEGIPTWTFDSNMSHVTGLKRQAAAPTYQSNCFVGSLGEAVSGTLTLYDGAGVAATGANNPLAFSLGADQLIRYLDIFNTVGMAAGDYANHRATFVPNNPQGAALLAFCTVQESSFFGADFRIAKSFMNGLDYAQLPSYTITGTLGTSPNDRMVFTFLARNPDLLSCQLNPGFGETDPITKLELRLLDPSSAPVAGGNDLQSFAKVTLPGRGATVGFVTAWTVEVEGTAVDSTGYKFALNCTSGNGIAYLQLDAEGLARLF